MIDGENIFQCKRFKIQLVGSIVIGRDSLGVAVDDDGLKTELAKGLGCVDAAVVKFNTLADPVGAAAQDHDLGAVRADGIIVRRVVSGVVICAVLRAAYVYSVPGLNNAESFALMPDLIFRYAEDLAEILIGETVFLGLDQGL